MAPDVDGRRRPRGQTRQRVLDTAARLFLERGYAGTSVRDLAQELGITKAAVHYHFAAKEQIVAALLAPVLAQYAHLLDAAERDAAAATPLALLSAVRDLLVEHGPLLSVLTGDPSVAAASADLHREVQGLAARSAQLLAGPGAPPERLLRAHCAFGALFAGWDTAWRSRTGVRTQELDVVLAAALAALGEG